MQTRRDHLQGYQFAVGRLATALVTGDTGRGTGPTRRGTLGTYFGILLVVLLCAGFGVFGLIKPVQKDTWRQPGTIILEKETGNRYLLVNSTLRPVLNYASALLLTGSSGTVRTVPREALASIPRGPAIGIPGAPDSLPSGAEVLSAGWSLCLRPGVRGEILDLAPSRVSALPSSAQAVLAAPDGTRYVLWRGMKYPVPGTAVLIALGLDGEQLAAPQNWLARVPTGTELSAPTVPHSGSPAGEVAGKAVRVGQLFRTPAEAGGHTYVMLKDGVAPVSATQAALMAARPGTAAVRTVDASAVAASPVSRTGLGGTPPPDLLNAPQARTQGTALCLRQVPQGTQLTSTIVREANAAATGDRAVVVPPGHGVLVLDQDEMRAGDNSPQQYLVDDQGVYYPLGDSQAASSLRLSGTATPMPSDVLALMTRGPVLDAAAAAAGSDASGGSGTGTPSQGTSGESSAPSGDGTSAQASLRHGAEGIRLAGGADTTRMRGDAVPGPVPAVHTGAMAAGDGVVGGGALPAKPASIETQRRAR
ncbi:hypothetical protein RVR_2444 [Actinacidiphila reveromycinica]|uniref:Type VII secretion protein EccB n=1 Tax=Actinacidiphila reveromycinica TaxID=659352 RepID=A0A7U3UQM0_9ACTN|nr:type VII secretion protein EccB [Streptomyces sp. SN-593]BBA96922.1 hypothetical protein RVR_2444 [Streptomyces sp. SN-593]